jgi:hypothetical protein
VGVQTEPVHGGIQGAGTETVAASVTGAVATTVDSGLWRLPTRNRHCPRIPVYLTVRTAIPGTSSAAQARSAV